MSTTQRNGARTVTARPPREGCGCKPNKDGLCCATKACGCRKEGEECGPHCDCGGTFTAPAPLCDGHQLPCALVTTKEGANRGRRFFGCSKSRAESCGYFRWAQGQEAPNGGCCARARRQLPGGTGDTADAAIDLSDDGLDAEAPGTGGGRGGRGGRGGGGGSGGSRGGGGRGGGRGAGRGGGGAGRGTGAGGGTGGGAARKKPMRKGKRKRCSLGAGCPYKHEPQHVSEYFHSDEEEEAAAQPVCQAGLEPYNSTPQRLRVCSRAWSLALGRAACMGSAAPADGAAAGAAAARTAGARQARARVSAGPAAASAAAAAASAAAAAASAAAAAAARACRARCAASACPSAPPSSCTWRSTSARATCTGCASSRRA